ncbi:NET1-associated nuclear protein 1 [Paramarasmius palmivorus]|uniref:NET1-associated nuclear protein 1 n=1 Tax=Paramarasmius palmivorus TaxID=297713 RepID=A0AAW0E470_9AGAR
MAASTSRQPQDIPLPPSPPASTAKPKKGKGKSKENAGSQKRRVGKSVSAAKSSEEELASDSTWDWVSLTDSGVSKVPPIFTKDGSYYFTLAGKSVKIFATATGQLVSTLSAPRTADETPSDVLTCAIINPHNPFQLIAGSTNGSLVFWDYMDAVLLRRIDIGHPIYHVCAHDKIKDHLFVSVTRNTKYNQKSGEENAVVLRVTTKPTDNTSHKPSEILPVGKTRFPTGLAISPSGEWLVATAGNKAYVANIGSLRSGFTKYVSSDRLNCLAFHPSEDYFATGDVKGNIKLWYCLNENAMVKVKKVEKKTQTANLHWHAHAVSSLTFTPNGAYLLSGGEESVLVIWQLHSGKKEFVPRVGAPIQTISLSPAGPHGEEYLLGLSDATHVFVSAANLRVSRSYSRMKLGPSMTYNAPSSSSSAPLAIHSLTSTVILPSSHPSSLQVYSPSHLEVKSELEVAPSNRVSRRDEKPLEPSRVQKIAIAPSGEWMASIDARTGDADFQDEVYLKSWHWDKKASTWILNTRIDRPHGLHEITDLSFSPRIGDHESYLITVGRDGTVKTWRTRPQTGKRSLSEEFWIARSSLAFRSQTPTSAAWSPDGTLLSVCLGSQVSLYNPQTNVLYCTFTSPESMTAKSAHFLGRGRYLAVLGEKEVTVWDIVLQSVRWTYCTPLLIKNLVTHPNNDTFALFLSTPDKDSQSHVLILNSSNPNPTKSITLPFGLRNVIWYSPRSSSSSFNLMGITHDWMVIRFGDDVQQEPEVAREIKASLEKRRTLFQDIFGSSMFANAADAQAEPSGQNMPLTWTGHESSGILDGPAHLMPPLESLYTPLMNTFMRRRPQESSTGPERPIDEDVEMEDEDEAPTGASRTSKFTEDREDDMKAFIELFKAQSITRIPPVKSKMNGAAKPKKANGVVHHAASPAPTPRPTPKAVKPIVASASSPLSSPVPSGTNSKKRKKTSD